MGLCRNCQEEGVDHMDKCPNCGHVKWEPDEEEVPDNDETATA